MLCFNAAILHLVTSMMSDGCDPVVLTEKDGKLYGRGSTDDKGPVLGWLHAVSAYNASKTGIPINLKVMESTMKDHYHHSYQKNPFKKYGDGYCRYNNKCSKCSRYGASVRCCVSECSKIYNYPCAIVSGALQCYSEPEQFRKLFIGGLNYKTTEETLKSHFEKWGEIVDCVVMRDPNTRRSRGFGFITYKNAHMVDDAQAARPHKIDGREVESKRAVPREKCSKCSRYGASVRCCVSECSKIYHYPCAIVSGALQRYSEPEQFRKLFIGGLNYKTTEETLKSHFEKWGEIVDCVVMRDPNTRRSRGFGFITYKNAHMVDDAQAARPHKIDGGEVEPKRAVPREHYSEPEQFRKLFIGGLNYKTTEETLKSHFEKWGEIVDCVVMRDPNTRRSRGFGFITYKNAHMVDDAQAASPHKVDGREVEPNRAVHRENMNTLPDSKSLVSNSQMKDTIISPVIPNQQDLLFLNSSEHSAIKIVGFTLQYAALEIFKQNSGDTVCS